LASDPFSFDCPLYTILRGPWYDIVFLNIHAPTEDKIHDMKERFYEELKHVFHNSLNTI
jgi:hypothetical protein